MQTRKQVRVLNSKRPGITHKPDLIEYNFAEVSTMILEARKAAYSKVDAILIELYWNIGRYISDKVTTAVW